MPPTHVCCIFDVVCRVSCVGFRSLSLTHTHTLSLSLSRTREVATRVRGSHVLRVACCVLRATRRRVARLAVGWRVCVCECECVFGVFVVLCVVDCSGWWGILFDSFVASLTKEAWYGSVEQ